MEKRAEKLVRGPENYETTDFERSYQVIRRVTTERFQYGNHIHPAHFEIFLYLRGTLTMEIEGEHRELRRGELAVIAPGEIHRPHLRDNSEYERIVMHVSARLLRDLSSPKTNLLSAFERLGHHFGSLGDGELADYERSADKLYDCEQNPALIGTDLMQQSYLTLLLLLTLNGMQSEAGTFVSEGKNLTVLAAEFIRAHLVETALNVQEIADSLNVSTSYLNRIFKRDTGYSLWRYVIYKRLIYAQKLILENRNVTEACYESGFSDYAHFIKSFSKTFGVPPRAYREQFTHHLNGGANPFAEKKPEPPSSRGGGNGERQTHRIQVFEKFRILCACLFCLWCDRFPTTDMHICKFTG